MLHYQTLVKANRQIKAELRSLALEMQKLTAPVQEILHPGDFDPTQHHEESIKRLLQHKRVRSISKLARGR